MCLFCVSGLSKVDKQRIREAMISYQKILMLGHMNIYLIYHTNSNVGTPKNLPKIINSNVGTPKI